MAQPLVDLKSLTLSERLQLMEDVWDSIAEEAGDALELPSEQRDELRRRLAAHDSAPEAAMSWEQVRRLLFREH